MAKEDPNKPVEGEEEEYVILENPPEEAKPGEAPKEGDEGKDDEHGDDEHGDDEDGDTRLGADEEGEHAQTNAQKRKERRERQKRAREAQEQELTALRQQVGYLTQRMAQQEGYALTNAEAELVRQYRATVQEARQAEAIMAKALEAQNGEDHTAAMRIRDAAMTRAYQINQQYETLQQQKAQPRQEVTLVDRHRAEWLSANPWFDPQGNDPDSHAIRAIDARMQQEGLDPSGRGYWQELTRRASEHFEAADQGGGGRGDTPPTRRSPPQGGKRETVPVSTRKEIYVTPERKAAMQEAGVWDDPAKRNRMLKAYAEYDRQGSGS